MSQAPTHSETTNTGDRPQGLPSGKPGVGGRPAMELPDISEKGAPRGGQPQKSDTRLYMQLLAFGNCHNAGAVAETLAATGVQGALYEDLNDPTGIAVVTMSTDPSHFIDKVRPIFATGQFAAMTPKPEFTMFGRTYSLGYEPDLNDALLHRPRRHVLTKDWPWAIWYPLRRSGQFEQLPAEQQRDILKEHGIIGMSFGAADFAHDVRLACHGLDTHDNDFVIGLFGKELYPLSAIVQRMRKTQQTSLYLERLGPFFVGRAVWQSEMK